MKRSLRLLFSFWLFVGFSIFFVDIGTSDALTRADYEGFDGTIIDQNDTWTKDGDYVFDKPVIIINDAKVTIEPGARIRFKRDQSSGDATGITVLDGSMEAIGTESEPIVFEKEEPHDAFSLTFDDESDQQSLFRYVHIMQGGEIIDNGGAQQAFFRNLFAKPALAAEERGTAALSFYYGRLLIENSKFIDSPFYDVWTSNSRRETYGDWSDASLLKIVNSNFEGNSRPAFVSDDSSCGNVDSCDLRIIFENDWYGSESGPAYSGDPDETKKQIRGEIIVNGWRKKDLIADPLVVIPGIIGSQKNPDGIWAIDPVVHTYDDLVSSLEENGYEKDINLFVFPYDWHRSNVDTAILLKNKIRSIRDNVGVSKVDIAAHSMGGLVARQYIEGDGYSNDIDQLITIGTPHKGAPESYLSWAGGEFGITIKDKILKYIFQNESEHAGYSELYKYIREEVPSVEQLLPDYDYLYDVSKGKMREYPSEYPRNEFLENLNANENIMKLGAVRFANIVGDVQDPRESTISRIRVEGTIESLSGKWLYGVPEDFGDETTDQGMEYDNGDGTVPFSSADSLERQGEVIINAEHNDLPTTAQCHILEKLTAETNCRYISEIHIPNILLLDVFSPVDIQVISPSGLRVGKDFDGGGFLNEIPGAYYTGSDTKNEFITIPNPEDGKYTILARGTDEGGTYRIETTKITEAESGETTESTATIEGEAVAGMMEEDMSVEVSADTVELIEDKDVVAPTITIISPESKTYVNSSITPVSYSVSDDVSPEEKLATVVSLDGEAYAKPDIDLSLLALGAHTLSVSSTDEAGNIGEAQADFTLATSWDALLENIDHYAALGFLKNKGERKMLENNIRRLGETAEILEKYDVFFRLYPKLRDIFEREIAHRLSILQRYVEHKSGKSIDPLAAERLVESMEALKSR